MSHLPITRRIATIVVFALLFLHNYTLSLWAEPVEKGDKARKKGKILIPHSDKRLNNTVPQERQIVLIGASYIKGWPIQEIANLKVINKGVNGNQSFEMLARFQQDVIANKPQIVVIWGFINDIFGSKREMVNDALEKVREHYKKMVAMSQDNGIIPIIATEITIRPIDSWKMTIRGWAGWILGQESYQAYVNKHVRDVNQWIKDFARENGLFLLDFEPILSDAKGFRKKEFATPDGSHISPKGYEALTLYTENRLRGDL